MKEARRIQIGPEFMWCEIVPSELSADGTYLVKLLNTAAFDDRYKWGDEVWATLDKNGNFQVDGYTPPDGAE